MSGAGVCWRVGAGGWLMLVPNTPEWGRLLRVLGIERARVGSDNGAGPVLIVPYTPALDEAIRGLVDRLAALRCGRPGYTQMELFDEMGSD